MHVEEVKQMLQLCDDFGSMAEGFGCRPVPAVRTAVQLQCKSYLDHLHQHTFTNLTGLHWTTCLCHSCCCHLPGRVFGSWAFQLYV